MVVIVIPVNSGDPDLDKVSRAKRAISTATCGWLTHGRFLFFARAKKRNQKKARPEAADFLLRFSPKSALA
jgi:hypothetical protein